MTKTAQLCSLLLLLTATVGHAVGEEASSPGKAAVRRDALGDPLPEDVLLRFGTLRFRYPSSVIELALSPDGESIVTIGREWLIVWDAATGLERWRADQREGGFNLPGASYGIRALAFDPNGKQFYTPGKSNAVVVWDLASGKQETLPINSSLPQLATLRVLIGGENVPRSVDSTSNGKRLAIGSNRGLVICDSQGKILHRILNTPPKPIEPEDMNRDRLTFGGDYSYGVFSPSREQLAAVLSEAPKEIRLLAVASGKEHRRIPLTDKLVRLDFSPDGRHIATTERDCAARLYAVETGKEMWSHEIEPAPRAESYTSALSFGPDGQTIAVCAPIGSDYAIYLLDAATGQSRHKLVGHAWKPWAVVFAPDGQVLYSTGWDGNIRRWDTTTGEQLSLPQGVHASGVVAASPVAPLVAYEDDRGTIHLVNSQDGTELRSWGLTGTNFTQLAFSPDGKLFAGGGKHGDHVRVVVWELETQKVVNQWDWPKGRDEHSSVQSLRFSPESKQLAAAVFRQGAGYLWDLSTGDQIAKLDHGEIYGLSFSPDGKSLVTVGWNSVIYVWDTETGLIQNATLANDGDNSSKNLGMYAVDHSPDGSLIATAHMNGSVRIWQAEGMLFRSTFKVDGSFSYDTLRFSPDSRWLATGSRSGRVSLWNPHSGKQVWSSRSHQYNVYNLEFGRNSRELVSGGDDGTGYWWDLRQIAADSEHLDKVGK